MAERKDRLVRFTSRKYPAGQYMTPSGTMTELPTEATRYTKRGAEFIVAESIRLAKVDNKELTAAVVRLVPLDELSS